MIVAFDNTFLSLAFHPGAKPRPNPATGVPVSHCGARIEALIDNLSERGDTVLIPAPCLAELLCVVPDINKVMSNISASTAFQVEPFDGKAAIALANVTAMALKAGDKKAGVAAAWQQVKFDRQIAMIAKVGRARTLFTDDTAQSQFAAEIGLNVKHTWDLDLPASHAQFVMDMKPPQGR